ncbi:MAG: hypothetical protein BGO97_06535 [Micrococcales bacterium 70-64]|nr:hypothetical protein [Leifsonia sp.]ODU63721.1 MAG: hypothetical protein ABT06_06540 [Leifsonia sp. SCN 70-46]OJX85412.1 MAG: hypothetical protein BGO97_06535 [Micrococcales bacterium 70-64]
MDARAAALEAQLRQLVSALDRLVAARRDLVPAPATFWAGASREAYDRALVSLDGELGSVIDAVALAQRSTVLAIAGELRHV